MPDTNRLQNFPHRPKISHAVVADTPQADSRMSIVNAITTVRADVGTLKVLTAKGPTLFGR
jgi:hypothetical protein